MTIKNSQIVLVFYIQKLIKVLHQNSAFFNKYKTRFEDLFSIFLHFKQVYKLL